MIIEYLWVKAIVMNAMQVSGVSVMDIATCLPLPHSHHATRKRRKKDKHHEKNKKMHRRAVRHMRHMQRIQEAIRQQRRSQRFAGTGGGVGYVPRGENMNADMLSKAGHVKQQVRQRLHQASRPKTTSVQDQLKHLRHRNHTSRIKAQRRAQDVFARAR